MPYCPRCGVEADPSVRSCPLCRTTIPTFADPGPGEPAWPGPGSGGPAQTYATTSELRSRAFLVVASVFATAAVAVGAVDLVLDGAFTWSRWPLASLAASFLLTSAVFAWPRRPGAWGTAWFVILSGFLAVLDLADDGRLGWSGSLGVPLVVATFVLLVLGSWLVRRVRRRGYNLIGTFLALVACELVAVDLLTLMAVSGHPGLGWSLVTSLVLGPGALLFFLLHYALARTPDFKRIFHF